MLRPINQNPAYAGSMLYRVYCIHHLSWKLSTIFTLQINSELILPSGLVDVSAPGLYGGKDTTNISTHEILTALNYFNILVHLQIYFTTLTMQDLFSNNNIVTLLKNKTAGTINHISWCNTGCKVTKRFLVKVPFNEQKMTPIYGYVIVKSGTLQKYQKHSDRGDL